MPTTAAATAKPTALFAFIALLLIEPWTNKEQKRGCDSGGLMSRRILRNHPPQGKSPPRRALAPRVPPAGQFVGCGSERFDSFQDAFQPIGKSGGLRQQA